MAIDERIKISFEHAANVVKQVLTLSTAIITITAVASRFIFTEAPDSATKWMLISWFLFIVSITSGVMGLMSLAGDMSPKDSNDTTPSIYNKGSASLVKIQLVTFLLGVIFVAVYGYSANA